MLSACTLVTCVGMTHCCSYFNKKLFLAFICFLYYFHFKPVGRIGGVCLDVEYHFILICSRFQVEKKTWSKDAVWLVEACPLFYLYALSHTHPKPFSFAYMDSNNIPCVQTSGCVWGLPLLLSVGVAWKIILANKIILIKRTANYLHSPYAQKFSVLFYLQNVAIFMESEFLCERIRWIFFSFLGTN